METDREKFCGFRGYHMPGDFKEHGKGLIQLYILHSLKLKPKSGYDLIKEISNKTDGLWVPSKGSLYPMLKKMEEENLIKVFDTGKRSKTIYEITENGRILLKNIIDHRKEAEERMYLFRELMFEIFSGDSTSVRRNFFEIRHILGSIPPEKTKEAEKITEKCLRDLKGLK
ncbi:MAG: PadR family transcriptional regulator [Methanomicrobiaceae archaeon]|nr:PadR family transcriptional regulator [Methanomicrobiaceae archaeon]